MTKRDAGRMESADHYPAVAQLTPKWRIIECRDGAQWILQRKSNKWEGRSYCRTSAVLERVVREHVGDVDLPDLPNWSTNGPVGGTWERRRHQQDLEQRAKDRNSAFRSML
jgi:hypothetical protein